ncbi:unnamed protein product [Amaranthus hypochondriacus]
MDFELLLALSFLPPAVEQGHHPFFLAAANRSGYIEAFPILSTAKQIKPIPARPLTKPLLRDNRYIYIKEYSLWTDQAVGPPMWRTLTPRGFRTNLNMRRASSSAFRNSHSKLWHME